MTSRFPHSSGRMKQRGVALFFAMICLVAIMLAAVTLIRSVDTSTMISGNLAFQQSATASGDGGSEAAIIALSFTQANDGGKNVLNDASHPFNVDSPTTGYYASLNPALSLTASSGACGTARICWTAADSVTLAADASGNTVSYIVQRMCSASGVAVQATNCLFSGAALDNNKQNIPLPQEICKGAGCPVAGQTPMNRITTKVVGPKNSLSYVQAFVY